YGSDLDGDGINETVNVTLSSSIVGFEPLAIGIGQCTRTVRSNETITGSILLSKTNTSAPFFGDDRAVVGPWKRSTQKRAQHDGTITDHHEGRGGARLHGERSGPRLRPAVHGCEWLAG